MTRRTRGMNYQEFAAARYFPNLDGLRAVSVILVVLLHSQDRIVDALHGTVGVTIFFLISGFLITTLLLREEDRKGQASLGGFYVRRIFRILPLFYLMLGVFAFAILVLGVAGSRGPFLHALPLNLTYQNDLANTNTSFEYTWSLAIEEKFYLLWPLVGFAVPAMRKRRLPVLVVLVLASALCRKLGPVEYFATYFPIALGCLLAVALDRETWYPRITRVANGYVASIAIAGAAAYTVLFESNHSKVHIIFSCIAIIAFPALITGRGFSNAVLANPVMRYVGTRSYAIYMSHLLCVFAANRLIQPGNPSVPLQFVHLLVIIVLSVGLGEILYRGVEQPMIRLGRRVTGSTLPVRTVPAVAAPVKAGAGRHRPRFEYDATRGPGER